jgi:hypothetical protein
MVGSDELHPKTTIHSDEIQPLTMGYSEAKPVTAIHDMILYFIAIGCPPYGSGR